MLNIFFVARLKAYNEPEVVEKAMNLFWKNGFEATSMQMLEKEMGINKFSIYASFENKNGLFIESLKCYKEKLGVLIHKMKNSKKGIADIEQYFYNFIEFSKGTELGKGCFVTNSVNEIKENTDQKIKNVLSIFLNDIKQVFFEKLQESNSNNKNDIALQKEADYLVLSIFGLANASKFFSKEQIANHIENIFKRM